MATPPPAVLWYLRAVEASSDLVARYVDSGQQAGAENTTINRELACLKRMYHLGQRMTPPKAQRVPAFPKLKEDNMRKGFLEDAAYSRLVKRLPRACFACWWSLDVPMNGEGKNCFGCVSNVDLLAKTLRLEPGTTKNRDGRGVTMTESIYRVIGPLLSGKKPKDAMKMLQAHQNGHSFGHSEPETANAHDSQPTN